jgi:hypothetical protein
MVGTRKTWKEKRIEKEEEENSSSDESRLDGKKDEGAVDVNMIFHLPAEFVLPEPEGAQLMLGAEHTVFEKPSKLGHHMKPLYVKGHLYGKPLNRMLVDGGTCMNILQYSVFEKLGHQMDELLMTNMTLNRFSGEASDAKGIICKELMIGSKTVPIAFFVVDVEGKYNVLLGRDWIRANGCVPSTLH